MRKIYLCLAAFALYFQAGAQTLNQSANWPNPDWTITGSYNTDPLAFESDPLTTANFAFDDDDAGNGHEDNIAAESPVINLTAAHTAGENFISITVDYGYRYLEDDVLRFEYWDADASLWMPFGSNIPGNETTINDDFCTITKTTLSTDAINISSFTATQLAGFRYRISYDDKIGDADWNYGFCFDSPTISSAVSGPIANCDAVLTSPADGMTDVGTNGVLTWSAATGVVSGYKLSVGTTSGGTDVLNLFDVGNVTTYDIPGSLNISTQYFVTITSYNGSGNTTGCAEYSFTTITPSVGSSCQNPLVMDSLPYSTSDDTANYTDLFYDGSPGASGCGSTNDYLNGNDVVYSYTAPANTTGSIKVVLTPSSSSDTYLGVFVYGSCSDIGVNCIGGAVTGFSSNPTSINELSVTAGQTYYFVVSTWASPQTAAYTLDVTENTCTNGTATYTVVSDCANGEQFLVKVGVTSMGTAVSMTATDDQGSASQPITAVGVYTFGPYPNNTPVVFTLSNDADASCVLTSPVKNQLACPPVNDDATGAIELTLDLGTACGANAITGISNASTTPSSEVAPSCTGIYTPTQGNGDIWYKIIAPSAEFTLNATVETGLTTVSGSLYSGTPGNLTEVGGLCGNTWPKAYTGLTAGQTYYYRVWDSYNDEIGTFSICGYYLDCVNPTVSYSTTADCVNNTFNVIANVTNLGSATSLTVSDDQGSATQPLSAIGQLTFGPYAFGTNVIITTTNDQNAACTKASNTLSIATCPPVNDECSGALPLTIDASFCDGVNNNGDNTGATDSGIANPACFNYGKNDVWFSVAIPSNVATIDVSTDYTGGTNVDTEIELYSGACGSLVEVACDQDSGTTILSNGSSYNSKITNAAVIAGNTYFVRVSGYLDTRVGTFCLEVSTNQVLANTTFESENFKIYPNPVKDILNLSYTKDITNVAVFNLLGQQVITKSVNATQGKIDMSNLSNGTYLVKITADNQVKTIKVIKG